MKKALPFLLPLFFCCTSPRKTTELQTNLFNNCHQLVLVLSPDENAQLGELKTFEKQANGWQEAGQKWPVTVGRTGIAWGRGLHESQKGYQKKEGDGKSPAGIFRFGPVFGYAPPEDTNFKMPYQQSTKTIECVDDSESVYYNQLVNSQLYTKDWKSSEMMRRQDEQYKWGIVVEHNLPATAGGGSCIFFHIWSAPGAATSGCTAMTEENLLTLLHWLDPAKKPLLLQVTASTYQDWKNKFDLPALR